MFPYTIYHTLIIQWLALLLHIWEVLDFVLGLEISYIVWGFVAFPKCCGTLNASTASFHIILNLSFVTITPIWCNTIYAVDKALLYKWRNELFFCMFDISCPSNTCWFNHLNSIGEECNLWVSWLLIVSSHVLLHLPSCLNILLSTLLLNILSLYSLWMRQSLCLCKATTSSSDIFNQVGHHMTKSSPFLSPHFV
jgi:hypothetical protein